MTELQLELIELVHKQYTTRAIIEELSKRYSSTSVKSELLNMVSDGVILMDDTWEVKAK